MRPETGSLGSLREEAPKSGLERVHTPGVLFYLDFEGVRTRRARDMAWFHAFLAWSKPVEAC